LSPECAGATALRSLLAQGVSEGVFPGAVLRLEDLDGAGALFEISEGRVSSDPPGPAVTASTLFDVASLTKLFSLTVTLRLVASGQLSLDSAVSNFLEGRGKHLQGVTVRQLLEHRSGLPAWQPFYERTADVIQAALDEPLEASPGARHCYSDVGFLVLMAVLEKVGGLPYRQLMSREVLAPLGLYQTGYRATAGGELAALELLATGSFAATERCPYRGLVCGEVHDDNTWAMGGVAAHAGLFASAEQLGSFARAWWQAPEIDYLPAELRDEAWATPTKGGGHVLGWDTVSDEGSSAGTKLSRRSHGHLGFTGTSLWIDPDRAVAVVLLSNRVHPSRHDAIAIRRFRPRLHDAVADFIDRVQ
jgi:CubicO group peptidase (beta-lactamase class C family)